MFGFHNDADLSETNIASLFDPSSEEILKNTGEDFSQANRPFFFFFFLTYPSVAANEDMQTVNLELHTTTRHDGDASFFVSASIKRFDDLLVFVLKDLTNSGGLRFFSFFSVFIF